MKLSAEDLRDLNLLKYYRLIRRWVCKQYGLKDADLELLIYLDCKGLFKRDDFINGVFTYTWDKHRWERLRTEGWIDVWKERNRKDSKYALYKTSMKTRLMINRIYKIMLGEEDIPITQSNVFYKNKSYSDKVYNKAIDDMIKDKER
jgi:ADP-heptose:LPS heptosyltransferase